MNIKEIFEALITLFKQKKEPPSGEVSPQTEAEQPQTQASKKSWLEPVLPKIYGLKKNLIVLIFSGVMIIFISSILFGYFSGRGTQNKSALPDIQPATELQDPSKAIPNSYERLADYNARNKQAATQNVPKNSDDTAQPVPPKNQSSNSYDNIQIPQIIPNYNQNISGGYPYSVAPVLPEIAEQYAPEIDKKLNGSIRFFSSAPSVSNVQTGAPAENDNLPNSNSDSGSETKKKLTSGESQKPNYHKLNQFQLTAGTIIPVTLLTGLNSDIPGQVISQVRQNVYDSQTGKYLLIPQGSRLIGEYGNGNIKNGQNRISVNWNRLILPNGYSADLDNMPGVDVEGYTGLHDKVNNHTAKIMRAAFFTSILAAGATYAAGNQSSDNQSPGQSAVSGAAANIMTTGQKMMDKNLDMSPTIIVRPGSIFSVYVNRDLILKPY